MLHVCKKILLLILVLMPLAVQADAAVTSIEQLEEKMENITFCSETNKESCNRFNCLEACLNLSEDPIDCSDTCYLQVKNKTILVNPLARLH